MAVPSFSKRGRAGRRGLLLWAAAALWLALAVGGGTWLTRHAATPGDSAAAPEQWPSASVLPREVEKPTLVVLLHPRCACSRATVRELERLLARVPGKATTVVVLVKPPGVDGHEDWENGDLRRAAEKISGVRVVLDEHGDEGRRFHAATSGQALLYAADGTLVFNGGLTAARGHEGDSAGTTAIEAQLRDGLPSAGANARADGISRTRVFGCLIFGKEGSS